MRRAKRCATSCLLRVGQSSTPFAETRWMVLASPPKVPVLSDTSLARIQSQPFFFSFSSACLITCSVSAAKPTTRRGRAFLDWASVARMSGLAVSSSDLVVAPFFLSFWLPARAGRQHLRRGLDMAHRDAGGIRFAGRAGDQQRLGAELGERRRDGVALLAGG